MSLKVGAGKARLDYPLELYPAMSQFEVCEDQYDECNCRALAIESCGKRILLLAYELSDIPEVPNLEAQIAQAAGVKEENVIITVTHNHSSPCDRGACQKLSEEECAPFRAAFMEIELQASLEAAKQAVAHMRPARCGYGEINSYINANEITRDPEIGYFCDENGNGYSDKTLAILKFIDEHDHIICVLLNHCTHATFAMGLDSNGKHATSGNFTGITCRYLEDYFGGGAIALWTSGAAGNQHPLLAADKITYSYTDGYKTHPSLPAGADFMLMEHVGRQHAVDAINGISTITEYTGELPLRHVKSSLMLPTQQRLHSHQKKGPKEHRQPDYGSGVRSNQPQPAAPFTAPQVSDNPEHPAELKMELLLLGDIAIVGLGCELFCQIGRDIKTALPAAHTIVVTHTPGYVGDTPHQVGYIVDQSSVTSHHNKLYRNLKPGYYDKMIVDATVELYHKAKDAAEADG